LLSGQLQPIASRKALVNLFDSLLVVGCGEDGAKSLRGGKQTEQRETKRVLLSLRVLKAITYHRILRGVCLLGLSLA
jgi:hypothetical protein